MPTPSHPGAPSDPQAASGSGPRTGPAAGPAAARAARALEPLLAEPLTAAGFDLEEVTVTPAGRRSVVRVVVDRDGGLDLDAVAVASRLASAALDAPAADAALPGAYVLEVTSPGVDRPLTEARHWRRAQGRLVRAHRVGGDTLVGRVLRVDTLGDAVGEGDGAPVVVLDVGAEQTAVPLAELLEGQVQVEMTRAPAGADPADGQHEDEGEEPS